MRQFKVPIRKKVYTVRFVKRVDKRNSYGECDYKNALIKVRLGDTKLEIADTTLHELIHACDRTLLEKQVVRITEALLVALNKKEIRKILKTPQK